MDSLLFRKIKPGVAGGKFVWTRTFGVLYSSTHLIFCNVTNFGVHLYYTEHLKACVFVLLWYTVNLENKIICRLTTIHTSYTS